MSAPAVIDLDLLAVPAGNVAALRAVSGFTPEQCAWHLGFGRPAWAVAELSNKLYKTEWIMLMLLAKVHPGYSLAMRPADPPRGVQRVGEIRARFTNMTMREAAKFFGYQVTTWEKKEYEATPLHYGEWQVLQLIAGTHPRYVLQLGPHQAGADLDYGDMPKPKVKDSRLPRYLTPSQVKGLRQQAKMTQQQCADAFGYTISAWQTKETGGRTSQEIRRGEGFLLQLLAGVHHKYTLNLREGCDSGNPERIFSARHVGNNSAPPRLTPHTIQLMREQAKMTQQQCADAFGYALCTWQNKEPDAKVNKTSSSLRRGECFLLRLLAGSHHRYVLTLREGYIHPGDVTTV